jgi:hypothetical protein
MTEETKLTKPDTQHVEAIVVQPNALEQMERASIDIQIATAKKYPRSLDVFYKRATAMVTLDEETAKSCIYRRPVGKEGGRMKYVDGESIRLAEIVAASYGNIRAGGIVTEMEERYVKAVGMAHDLESNYAVRAEVVESTVTKHGVPFSERMRVVVAKAAQSKAIRDAIFRIVPKSVCKPLADKAKEVAKGDIKTFEARRKGVLEWIKSIKIKPERVWAAIGINGPDDIGMDDLVLLAGLKTAIEDKDVTVAESFPPLQADGKPGVEGLEERLSKPKDEEPPKKKRGRPKKEKKDVEAKGKEPGEQEGKGPEESQEETATQEKVQQWQCNVCHRITEMLDKNRHCPSCFSSVTEL